MNDRGEHFLRQITREDLLLGKNRVEDVYIPELEGTLPLRPLTDGEWAQVQNIQRRGMRLRTDPVEAGAGKKGKQVAPPVRVEFDLEEFTRAEYEADILIVRYGVALNPPLTDEDVRNMKAGVPAAIAREILKITGVSKETIDQIESFRAK